MKSKSVFLAAVCGVLQAAAAPPENSVGIALVEVPPGQFTMGSPEAEKGRGSDEAQVEVVISQAFFLGATEVTQRQWKEVMGTGFKELLESGSDPIGRGAKLVKEPSAVGPDQPMVFVGWEDAVAFCEKLTALEKEAGGLPEGFVYSLPTEAQWEYACRAGSATVFAHGDTLTSKEANFYGPVSYGVGWEGEYREKTTGAKTFSPNAWGLYDMHGNVYEWCSDWYTEQLPGGKDPEVATGGDSRIIRGGCWNRKVTSCRSAYRYSALPDRRTYNIGFRVALVRARTGD